MPYKVEVTQDPDPHPGQADTRHWSGNALVFACEFEARTYRWDLSMRWFGYTSDRIVETDEVVTYHYRIADPGARRPRRDDATKMEFVNAYELVSSPRAPYSHEQARSIVEAFTVAGEALDRLRERDRLSQEPSFLVTWEREFMLADLPSAWQATARRVARDVATCVLVVGHRKVVAPPNVMVAGTDDPRVYGRSMELMSVHAIPDGGCIVTGVDQSTLAVQDRRPRVHVRAVDAARALAAAMPELCVMEDMLLLTPPHVTAAEDTAREILAGLPENDSSGLCSLDRAILAVYAGLKSSHRERALARFGYPARVRERITMLIQDGYLARHGKGTKATAEGKRIGLAQRQSEV